MRSNQYFKFYHYLFIFWLNYGLITLPFSALAGAPQEINQHGKKFELVGNLGSLRNPNNYAAISDKSDITNLGAIKNNVITGEMIKNNVVTGKHIADDSISWKHIKPETIRAGNIVPGSITGYRIKEATVTANNLSPFVQSLLAEVLDATDNNEAGTLIKRNDAGGATIQDLLVEGDLVVQGDSLFADLAADTIAVGSTVEATHLTSPMLSISGQVLVGDDLEAQADAFILGELDVTEAVALHNALDVDGAATLGSSLGVSGRTTLSNARINGSLIATDDLTVSDSATIHGAAAISGAATVGSTLGVNGRSTLSDTRINGDLIITDDLTVSDSATIRGTLIIRGDDLVDDEYTLEVVHGRVYIHNDVEVVEDIYIHNDLEVFNNTTMAGTLDVTGSTKLRNAHISGSLTVTDDLTVSDSATIHGAAAISGATTVGGTLGVTGAATLSHNLAVGGTLGVTGNTSLSSLAASGNSTIGGTLGVTGHTTLSNARINGSLIVTDDLTVSDSATIHGAAAISGAATVGGALGVSGRSTLSHTRINGTTTITSDLTVSNSTTIIGSTLIGGDLSVSGALHADSLVIEGGYTLVGDDINIADDLTVSGSTTLYDALRIVGTQINSSDLTIGGSTTIAGKLSVEGAATLHGTMYDSVFSGSIAGIIAKRGAVYLHDAHDTSNIYLGHNAGAPLSSATGNSGIGSLALQNVTSGGGNTALGMSTLNALTEGTGNTAIGLGAANTLLTGHNNVAIGADARVGTAGTGSVVIGGNAGVNSSSTLGYNTLIGNVAGYSITSGTQNIALGYAAGSTYAAGSHNISIGNVGHVNDSGIIRLGTNLTHTSAYIAGTLQAPTLKQAILYDSALSGTLRGKVLVEKDLHILGTADIYGSLVIHGGTELGAVTIVDTQTLAGTDLHITDLEGSLTINTDKLIFDGETGDTKIGGDLLIRHDLTVSGSTTLHDDITLTQLSNGVADKKVLSTDSNGTLVFIDKTGGDATFDALVLGEDYYGTYGDYVTNPLLSVGGDAYINGDLEVDNRLYVADDLEIGADLYVEANARIHGAFDVDDFTTLHNKVVISDYLTTYSQVAVGGALTVTGSTNLASSLSVAGNSTLSNVFADHLVLGTDFSEEPMYGGYGDYVTEPLLSVGGDAYINDDLEVDGSAYVQNNINFGGKITYKDVNLINTADGFSNLFVGQASGRSDLTGSSNTAVGPYSLITITAGKYNSAFGNNALERVTTGEHNTGIGFYSLSNIKEASNNVSVGASSLVELTSGESNTVVGSSAGYHLKTGNNNTLIGDGAGLSLKAGESYNIYIGSYGAAEESQTIRLGRSSTHTSAYIAGTVHNATLENATLYDSKISGTLHGKISVESELTVAGAAKFSSNINILAKINKDGSSYIHSPVDNTNMFVGSDSGNNDMSGTSNTSIGAYSMTSLTDGGSNTAVGQSALNSLLSGTLNVAVGVGAGHQAIDGSNNVMIGTYAQSGLNANNSVVIGSNAGTLSDSTTGNNTIIGADGAQNLTSGNNNIVVGYAAGSALVSGNKNIYIAANGAADESQTIRLGNSSTHTSAYIAGIIESPIINNATIYESNISGTIRGTLSASGVANLASINTEIIRIGDEFSVDYGDFVATPLLSVGGDAYIYGDIEIEGDTHSNTLDIANKITYQGSNLLHVSGETTNLFVGIETGKESVSGGSNTAVGSYAMSSIKNALYNTAVGTNAMTKLSSGEQNTGVGFYSLYNVTEGSSNISLGGSAFVNLTTGSNNIAAGSGAGYNLVSGTNNILVGTSAGLRLLSDESYNIYIDHLGAAGEQNTIRLGNSSTHTSAYIAGIVESPIINNATIYESNISGTLHGKTVIGGGLNVGGNTVINGDLDVMAGLDVFGTLTSNMIVTGPIFATDLEVSTMTVISGAEFKSPVTVHGNLDANDNATFGARLSVSDYLTTTSQVAVGGALTVTGSTSFAGRVGLLDVPDADNTGSDFVLVLDGDTVKKIDEGYITSSRRYKHDIRSLATDDIVAKLNSLKPVSFVYNKDTAQTTRYGLVAEEVADVLPALVKRDAQGRPDKINLKDFPALLVSGFQHQQQQLDTIEQRVQKMLDAQKEDIIREVLKRLS